MGTCKFRKRGWAQAGLGAMLALPRSHCFGRGHTAGAEHPEHESERSLVGPLATDGRASDANYGHEEPEIFGRQAVGESWLLTLHAMLKMP